MKSKITTENKKTENPLSDAIGLIQQMIDTADKILVVSHIDPDGDALGTQLAFGHYLRALGKHVRMLRDSDIPDKYLWMPEIDQVVHFDDCGDSCVFDTAVVLECPNFERIGRVRNFITKDTTIINIDHHYENDQFGGINWQDTTASSVGEMVYEYLTGIGHGIDAAMATQLYTAILTDTGRFRFASTSSRTMEIVSQLIDAGAEPQKICDQVYFNLRPEVVKLIGKVLNEIEFHHDGRICVLKLTKEMLEMTGANDSDSDGLVDFTLFTGDVAAGVLIKEVDDKRSKVSLRSRDGINVSDIAARFGGGGHFNASGCYVQKGLDKTKTTMIEILREAVDEQAR